MNLLSDIITYVRRIIKSPSNAVITDNLIIDYINRFWINDVDARMQLFDLKTKYQFQTRPGFDQYNMPLYSIQPDPSNNLAIQSPISYYPVYQGFFAPVYVNGVQIPFETQKNLFQKTWPNIVQNMAAVAIGNGTTGPYIFQFPTTPNYTQPLNIPFQYFLRGHVDMSGVISTGSNPIQDPPLVTSTQINANNPFIQNIPVTSVFPSVYITSIGSDGSNVVISDSGQFLADNQAYGLLMQPGPAPFGNLPLPPVASNPRYSTTSNTINYFTGEVTVNFPVAIPKGVNISAQAYLIQSGLPRGMLFYNNTLTLRSPPDRQYLVELDAYLSPAAFLTTGQAVQFGYMSEYIARGAARKILADTGDVEQFQFYEPLFLEQEILVWKRSQRQFTSTRTQTIYSQGVNHGQIGSNGLGGQT